MAALARCVGDVDRFGTELWGQQPFVWRDRGCFTDLLTTEDVETLLRSAGRRPSFRLVRDGQTLPPAASTRPVRIGGTVVDDAADLARITALVGGGATIVLQGLHHLWPPLQRFCGRLERATSHAVQANAYLSPPGAAALRHHRDTHEVLALQVEGSKTWHIDGLGPVTMEAGDVAYLPAGTGHAAAAQDRHSLHVTIGVLATTYAAALQRVVAGACGDLGRPLPLGFARPDHEDLLTDGMARALRAAGDHLRAVDPAEVAGAEIRRADGPSSPARPRHAARRRRPLRPRRRRAAARGGRSAPHDPRRRHGRPRGRAATTSAAGLHRPRAPGRARPRCGGRRRSRRPRRAVARRPRPPAGPRGLPRAGRAALAARARDLR